MSFKTYGIIEGMKYHFVYCTTCLVNDKRYIGIHSTNNLNDHYLGSGVLFTQALRKHGVDNFEREILFWCDDRYEAIWLEAIIVRPWFVKRWGKGKEFYNLGSGGAAGKPKLDHSNYVARLQSFHHGQFIALEPYRKSHVRITHQCTECGHVFSMSPQQVLTLVGCLKCDKEKKLIASQKKMQEKIAARKTQQQEEKEENIKNWKKRREETILRFQKNWL